MSEGKKCSGVPENEGLWRKMKRKARTAGNWAKTHWKGLALGALAIGGGAYMLSRHGEDDEDETVPANDLDSGGCDYRERISRAFDAGDGSTIGPEDDEPDEED